VEKESLCDFRRGILEIQFYDIDTIGEGDDYRVCIFELPNRIISRLLDVKGYLLCCLCVYSCAFVLI